MKKMLVLGAILAIFTGLVAAQDESTEPTSTVFFFFAACENQAVIDLDGTMEAGYDVYIQFFRELNATGEALTNRVRVPVSGDYQVSQTVAYNNGTLNLGQFASVRVSIALESNADSEIYSDTLDDVQDGCIDPTYSSVDTIDVGSGVGADGGTPLIDPVTGEVVTGTAGEAIRSSGIYTPDGGVLNEVFGRPQEAVVQIGARPSESVDVQLGRVSDPGLIFAECDAFDGADPGIVYDTDNITVFWSWFATIPELARQHQAFAQYEVFLTSDYAYRQPFPFVDVRPLVQREDENYWTFYVANLGDGFRPGTYRVDYYVTWSQPISDGIAEFGPGTETPFILNTCTFEVVINPFGISTDLNNPTVPLQSGG